MTSSGTYNFTIPNSEGVLAALERVQIRSPSIRAEHMVSARRELNFLFVEMSNKQVNLFKVEQASTSLVAGTSSYSVDARTVMILDAWITTGASPNATDRYITPISRTEYATFSNKATSGFPTCFWFDRLISPTITLWPVPDSGGPYTLNYYFCSQQQDANLPGGETPDLPYRWLDVLVSGLAYRLARIYKPELEQVRKQDYSEAWSVAATQDVENVNLSIFPNIGAYYRR